MSLIDELTAHEDPPGLHYTLSWQAVNSLKHELAFRPESGRLDVTHFPDPCVFLTFPQLVSQRGVAGSQPVRIIDTEKDDVLAKISLYISKVAPAFYEHESSGVMRQTLKLAAELCANKMASPISSALRIG